MKLFEFIKKRKVEDKPQSGNKTAKVENSSMNQNQLKMESAPRANELYFDDSDIGYC